MPDDAHLTIVEVSPLGVPFLPIKNANTFIHQCGFVVRDNVPISIINWNKPAKRDENSMSYVKNR